MHRLLWIDDAGKPWAAIVKRTANDEIYLQSYPKGATRAGASVGGSEKLRGRAWGATTSPAEHRPAV